MFMSAHFRNYQVLTISPVFFKFVQIPFAMRRHLSVFLFVLAVFGCTTKPHFDKIIRNGLIYDGRGGTPYKADIGVNADTIAQIGDLPTASATEETDAKGKAVAPGFINMLSQAQESLIEDGRSQSD